MTSSRLESKTRAFDLILNLGVHAHLLEPPTTDDASTIEEYCKETYLDNEIQLSLEGNKKSDYLKKVKNSSAIDKFECWILGILYEILLHLVQVSVPNSQSSLCACVYVCNFLVITFNVYFDRVAQETQETTVSFTRCWF